MANVFSRPASRFSFLWMGSCLLGGFAVGSKVHSPLKTTTLHFEKIAWVTDHESVQLAQIDSDEFKQKQLNISVDFTPFELPARKAYRPRLSQKTHKRRVSSWTQLDRAIKNLKLTSLAQIQRRLDLEQENLFVDYSSALRELRRDFLYAMIPTYKSDEVQTMASSAQHRSEVSASSDVQVMEVQYGEASKPEKLDTQAVSIHKNNNNPDPNANLGISERVTETPFQKILPVVRPVAKKATAPVKVVSPIQIAPAQETTAEQLDAQVQQLVQLDSLTGRESTAKIPETKVEVPVTAPVAPIAAAEPKTQEFATYFNSSIGKDEQKVLTEALLNEQMKALNGMAIAPKPTAAQAPLLATQTQTRAPAAEPEQKRVQTGFGDKIANADEDETVPEVYSPAQAVEGKNEAGCAQLTQTRLINTLGSQVCPVSHAWISKNWMGSGWVKVESAYSPNLLLYYPSPNTGTALAMDTNSVALLGLTSGAKVMKGMGVIVGLAPEGFEVEFVGRAEDPEYFQIQSKRYFAIINAEPGAGVIQLISKQNQEDSATVFAPVLEDTITYLDLVAPKNANFTVRVVKNGGSDPEVSGLTVGVSTGGKIQAITQAGGRASLRNVPTVPGYPIYIDVSSKMKNERGYMYRYLLKNRNRAGDYVVYQVAEKSLFNWIRQVKQGLSDQSAMVVGFFNRDRLGGFKEHYFAKSVPQTARFGLEPLNFSVLWNGEISSKEPLEGDLPRFMSVQVPEGLTQLNVSKESGQPVVSELIPVSPRVIHVVSE